MKDEATGKVRTAAITEKLTCIAWRTARDHIKDRQKLMGEHQMMSRPHGCIIAAQRIQGHVDKGNSVLLVDCVNRHPTLKRSAVREVVATEPWAPVQRLWNFLYTSAFRMTTFHRDGSVAYVHETTDGSIQGCASAADLQQATDAEALRRAGVDFSLLVSIMDDVAIFASDDEDAKKGHDAVGRALEWSGGNVFGPKTQLLAKGVVRTFGGALVGDRRAHGGGDMTVEDVVQRGQKPMKRFVLRMKALRDAAIPLHHKLLLLKHASLSLVHVAMASAPELIRPYASAVKQVQLDVVAQLVGTTRIAAPSIWTQLTAPSGSMGLGLLNLTFAHLLAKMGAERLPGALAGTFEKYPHPLRDKDSEYGAAVTDLWRGSQDETRPGRRFTFLEAARPWHENIPDTKETTLSDGAVTFALRHLLRIPTTTAACRGDRNANPNDEDGLWGCTAPPGTLDHTLLCVHCATVRYARHEAVLRALLATSSFFGGGIHKNVHQILGVATPSATDGRHANHGKVPDAWTMRASHVGLETTLILLDVTVVHLSNGDFPTHSPLQRMYAHKLHKYRGIVQGIKDKAEREGGGDGDDEPRQDEVPVYKPLTNEQLDDPQRMVWSDTITQRVMPIVFTSDGFVHEQTWRHLRELATGTATPRDEAGATDVEGFARSALRRMQAALLNTTTLQLGLAELTPKQ
jgi:hypothetical protein